MIERLDVKVPKPGTNLVDTDIDVVTRDATGQLIYWQAKRPAGAFKSVKHATAWVGKVEAKAAADGAIMRFITRPGETAKLENNIRNALRDQLGQLWIKEIAGV